MKYSIYLAINAMEWNGMEWNGMEWNGMEWNRILAIIKNRCEECLCFMRCHSLLRVRMDISQHDL